MKGQARREPGLSAARVSMRRSDKSLGLSVGVEAGPGQKHFRF
jgi:hypothetical protein